MATPFDETTWQLRFDSIEPPASPFDVELNQLNQLTHAVATLTASIYTPLKSRAKFCVHVASDHTATVEFEKEAPEKIRQIWSDAENVYYDPEFYTVRGDLDFDVHSGVSGGGHGHHFVITYRGKAGTGGKNRELFVGILDEHAADDPTADLVRRDLGRTGYFMHHRGSWKADD